MFNVESDPRGFRKMTIGGEIDADGMKQGLEAFLSSLSDEGETDFLYIIKDLKIPSFDALAVEFRYLPTLMAALPKIGRVAVVADQAWLRTAAEVEGKIIPGLTIESFAERDIDDAVHWLTGTA